MRVSVAICTYNGAAYLAEQLISILSQDPPPFEVVLGDDASSDDSVAVAEWLFAEHRAAGHATEFVIRRHDPGLGVSGNFADALSHTRGDLVALSDQDDIWHPGKLAALVAAFEADPSLLLVHTDARMVDGTGEPTGLTLLEALEITPGERAGLEGGDAFAALLHRNLVTGATMMVRRELIDTAAPFPEEWVHDEWLAALASATGSLRLMPEPLIDYRQHGRNQIGAHRPTMSDRMKRLQVAREPRATRLVDRGSALVAKLESLGDAVSPEALDAARARLAFDERRRALPRVRVGRLPRITAGALRGDYSRYARGSMDVLRDITHPAPRPGHEA